MYILNNTEVKTMDFRLCCVCMLSCFIGYLWISPYINQVTVEFYREVKGELDAPPSDDTFYENDSIHYSSFTNY